MRRFAHSVRKDTMLQFRCGFYFVGGFVALFYVGLLRQIPDEWLVNLPLVPAALALNVLMTTFYFVAALVLLEKSEGTLPALAASPLRVSEYLGAKVASLTLLAMAENAHFPFSTLAAFGAPFMALFLASFTENKVTGFAMMKLMNAVQILPVVAYFVPLPAQLLFGIVPAYWPMKMVWLTADGRPYGVYLVAGLVVNVAAVGLLLRRFDRVVHR